MRFIRPRNFNLEVISDHHPEIDFSNKKNHKSSSTFPNFTILVSSSHTLPSDVAFLKQYPAPFLILKSVTKL